MSLIKTLPPCTIYARQKAMAKVREIDWQLTFEEWWNIWEQSGKYEQRGRGRGKYVMSRKGDTGPYAVNNVYIQLHETNNTEAHKGKPQKAEHIAKRVAKQIGVKHSPERKLANSLGQLNGNNIFVLRAKNKLKVGT